MPASSGTSRVPETLKGRRRVLVTGGAGFIGSHLCARLLLDQHQVFCLDNLCTGSLSNIRKLSGHPLFTLLEQDIVDPVFLNVDCIFNLACPASPVHYQANPVKTTLTSVLGALNVLELSRQTGAVVLQSSTSEVYGDPAIHPQVEHYWGNVNPIGPRACYDEGKRCAESLFFDYRRLHLLPIKVARIFNTYGPHMHPNDGRVVSTLLVQALRNQALTVYGDGQQTRSFCYVDDMVDGLLALAASPEDLTGPVNLGNPEELTILELVEQIVEVTNSRSLIQFHPLPQDDPRLRRPDISFAREQLRWAPRTPIRTGLEKTARYFDQILQGQSADAEALFLFRAQEEHRPSSMVTQNDGSLGEELPFSALAHLGGMQEEGPPTEMGKEL